jgi:Antitoxin VbhA
MSKNPPADGISSAEIERRRAHVRTADADNRIEGIQPSRASLEISDAYIRGEIEAHDLVAVYKKRQKDEAKETLER